MIIIYKFSLFRFYCHANHKNKKKQTNCTFHIILYNNLLKYYLTLKPYFVC